MAKRLYEGMFVLRTTAGGGADAGEGILRQLFEKHGVECNIIEKWDERRLAYEIDKERRGVYWLTVLMMEPDAVKGLRRDLEYNNDVLRYLLLQEDNLMELRAERAKLAEKRAKESIHSRRRRRR